MASEYVTVDRVQAPVYVTGERFPTESNVGTALQHVERKGLIALTGPTGAHARIVAPSGDKIWEWFTTLTGIYNVTDHNGRFGRKGTTVNVVAHGACHPLSRSQRLIEAAGTDYTRDEGTAQLSEGEELELLAEEGTPIFAYDQFLERSEDPEFLSTAPCFRVVRTQAVLGTTKHGVQPLSELYDNSSVLCYVGGKSPVKVTTPEGEEKTVTVAQTFVDLTGKRFNRSDLGVWLHESVGGRLLVFGDIYDVLVGNGSLNDGARFVGVGAGGAEEVSPRSGDASEQRVVAPTLDQMLALGQEFVPPVARAQFEQRVKTHYQQ